MWRSALGKLEKLGKSGSTVGRTCRMRLGALTCAAGSLSHALPGRSRQERPTRNTQAAQISQQKNSSHEAQFAELSFGVCLLLNIFGTSKCKRRERAWPWINLSLSRLAAASSSASQAIQQTASLAVNSASHFFGDLLHSKQPTAPNGRSEQTPPAMNPNLNSTNEKKSARQMNGGPILITSCLATSGSLVRN